MELDQKRVATAIMAVPGIGPQTYHQLKAWCQFHGYTLWEWWYSVLNTPVTAIESGLSSSQLQALTIFQRQYSPDSYVEWLTEQEISVFWEEDPSFPQQLFVVPGHPIVLFAQGAVGLITASFLVGVVGTRKITSYGEMVTTKVTQELVKGGAVIVSGGMYGVDLTAHKAALEAGGQTIAVLGFGFGQWYPVSHRQHQAWLLGQGALLMTEYAPGVPPQKGTFLQRNRIIAALVQALVVTEAAARSGSLNTAHTAVEYGRDVWAVPGPITSVYSEGVKNLLNEGAQLLSSGYDVWKKDKCCQLPLTSPKTGLAVETATITTTDKILKVLEGYPQTTEQIQGQLQLPIGQILTALSLLEIQHQIEKRGATWIKI